MNSKKILVTILLNHYQKLHRQSDHKVLTKKELTKRVLELEEEIYNLKNPIKYKVGDEVVFSYMSSKESSIEIHKGVIMGYKFTMWNGEMERQYEIFSKFLGRILRLESVIIKKIK